MRNILLLSLLLILMTSFASAIIEEDNLVAYYFINNVSTTVIDESTQSQQFNGTAVNGVVMTQNGTQSAEATFDGVNDYIDLGDIISEFETEITISMWFYDDGADTNQRNLIASRNDQVDSLNYFQLRRSSSGFLAISNDAGSLVYVEPTYTWDDADWHFVAFRVDTVGNNLSLYVDNSYVASIGYFSPYFGYDDGSGGFISTQIDSGGNYINYWDGKISNIAVWNTTLSDAQLTTIYNLNRTNYMVATNPIVINEINITNDPSYWDDSSVSCNVDVDGAEYILYNWTVNGIEKNSNNITTDYNTSFASSYNYTDGTFSGLYSGDDPYTMSFNETFVNHTEWVTDENFSTGARIDSGERFNLTFTPPQFASEYGIDISTHFVSVPLLLLNNSATSLPQQCSNDEILLQYRSSVQNFNGWIGYALEIYCYNSTEFVFVDYTYITGNTLVEVELNYSINSGTSILSNGNYTALDNVTCQVSAINGSFSESDSYSTIILGSELTEVNLTNVSQIQNLECNYAGNNIDNVSVLWYDDNVNIFNQTVSGDSGTSTLSQSFVDGVSVYNCTVYSYPYQNDSWSILSSENHLINLTSPINLSLSFDKTILFWDDSNVSCLLNSSGASLTNTTFYINSNKAIADCTQEDANVSNPQCPTSIGSYDIVGFGDGGFPTFLATDNNYSSYTIESNTGNNYLYANYTVPDYAGYNNSWEIKTGHNFGSVIYHNNYSIPTYCLSTGTAILRLRFGIDGSKSLIETSCLNSTSWVVFHFNNTLPTGDGHLYEDSLHWSFSTDSIDNTYYNTSDLVTCEGYGTTGSFILKDNISITVLGANVSDALLYNTTGFVYDTEIGCNYTSSHIDNVTVLFYQNGVNVYNGTNTSDVGSVLLPSAYYDDSSYYNCEVIGYPFFNTSFSSLTAPENLTDLEDITFENLTIVPNANATYLFGYNASYDLVGGSVVNSSWSVNGVNVLNNNLELNASFFALNDNVTFNIVITNGLANISYDTSINVSFPIQIGNQFYQILALNESGNGTNFSVDAYLLVNLSVNLTGGNNVNNDQVWYVWWNNGVELIKGWGLNVISFFFNEAEQGTNIISVNGSTNPLNVSLGSNTLAWNITVTTPTLEPDKLSSSGDTVYDSIVVQCSHNYTGHVWYYDIDVNVTNSSGDTFWVDTTESPIKSGNVVFDLTPYNNSPNYQVRCRTWNQYFNYSNFTISTDIEKKSKNDIKLFQKLARPIMRGSVNSFTTKCVMDRNDKYKILYHWHDTNGDEVWERIEAYDPADNVNVSSYGFNTQYLVKDNVTISTGCRIEKRTDQPWEFPYCDEKLDICDIQKKYSLEVLI